MSVNRKMSVAVVMPCFNEQESIKEIILRVLKQSVVKELIIIDDGSTDDSLKIIKSIKKYNKKIVLLQLDKNYGKGYALKQGFKLAKSDIIIIQDADLEYNPQDYKRLIEPIKLGLADVVYGSRFKSSQMHRVHLFWHKLGNNFLTFLSNIFTNLSLSDMETGYKVFVRPLILSIELREYRFGFEPEITAKLAKKHAIFYEVPISYFGRSYKQGKKITWRDGISAIRCIIRYSLL